MKRFFTISLCLVALTTTHAQISKTIHHVFTIEGVNEIVLDLDGQVVVEERGGSRLLVEMNISVENANGPILEEWIEDGRYEIEMIREGNRVTIQSKKPDKDYRRAPLDVACREILTYTVFIPSYMKAVKRGDGSLIEPTASNEPEGRTE